MPLNTMLCVSEPDPDWIPIGSGLDPDSIRPVDPDPYSESGSGSRKAKRPKKVELFLEISCFEVLDVLL